jgi:hypothetical protein
MYKYVCLECGNEYEQATYRQPRRRYCINCSMAHLSESMKQLHNHEGPYFEKWKESMRHAIER